MEGQKFFKKDIFTEICEAPKHESLFLSSHSIWAKTIEGKKATVGAKDGPISHCSEECREKTLVMDVQWGHLFTSHPNHSNPVSVLAWRWAPKCQTQGKVQIPTRNLRREQMQKSPLGIPARPALIWKLLKAMKGQREALSLPVQSDKHLPELGKQRVASFNRLLLFF